MPNCTFKTKTSQKIPVITTLLSVALIIQVKKKCTGKLTWGEFSELTHRVFYLGTENIKRIKLCCIKRWKCHLQKMAKLCFLEYRHIHANVRLCQHAYVPYVSECVHVCGCGT